MPGVREPRPLGLKPSFGFGDRIGLATPGHLDAMRAHGGQIMPFFAQQSAHEMNQTGRTPSDVMSDAVRALRGGTFTGNWSADANRLLTPEDVNAAVGSRFVYFTIDISDHIDSNVDTFSVSDLTARFKQMSHELDWIQDYIGKTVQIENGPKIVLDELTVKRTAVKLGRAIAHGVKMAAHVDRMMGKRGRGYEIELCLHRAPFPTTAVEHFIIVDQYLRSDLKLVSLAPRYAGQFDKGVDFQGDVEELLRTLAEHVAISRQLGPYKMSLHSGADKLSIYEDFARLTGGMLHIKTSGASYLEALRVVCRHDTRLFIRVVETARERLSQVWAKQLKKTSPPSKNMERAALERDYLTKQCGREILHTSCGSILGDPSLGPAIRDVLQGEPESYRQVLAKYFGRHLKALRQGL